MCHMLRKLCLFRDVWENLLVLVLVIIKDILMYNMYEQEVHSTTCVVCRALQKCICLFKDVLTFVSDE